LRIDKILKPLSVLFVLDAFPTLSETFLYTLIQNLVNAGVRVKVVARKRGKADQTPAFARDVRFLPGENFSAFLKLLVLLGMCAWYLFASPRKWFRFWQKIGQLECDTPKRLQVAYRCMPLFFANADVIYLPFGGLAVMYAELFEISSIPIVFSLRGSDIRIEPLVNPDYARLLQRVMLKADRIHCVANDIKQVAIRLSGVSAEKLQVIYTSINPIFQSEPSFMDLNSPLRIISMGRLDWKKGLEHGMMSIAELQKRGVSCTWEIVGEGPYRIPLEWAVRDMGLQEVVMFSGAKKQDEIINHLKYADIFFHPSVSEGLSNSVLEAMACGLPVVCSDVGGMREAIPSDEYGYLVPARDWKSAAEALNTLIANPDLRRQIGIRAAGWVRVKFTAEQQVNGFMEMFQAAIQQGKSS